MEYAAPIITALAPLITALALLLAAIPAIMAAMAASKAVAKIAEIPAKIEEIKQIADNTHLAVNSKMEELLRVVKAKAYAEGKLEGKAEAVEDARIKG